MWNSRTIYSRMRNSMILQVCLLLCIGHSILVAQDFLTTTSKIATGASFCLARSNTCILLKACNFRLVNSSIPAGGCFEGTSELFADFSSIPPVLGFDLDMLYLNFSKQCDCSACGQLCSTTRYNTSTSTTSNKNCQSSPKPDQTTSSSPSTMSQKSFRLNALELDVTANACIALSQENNCLLGKFCNIRLNSLEQGQIIPPVCIQASANIIASFNFENPFATTLQFELTDIRKQLLSGRNTVCSCTACDQKPCTTNPLMPVT